MAIERNQKNREALGKEVAAVINNVFQQGTQVSVHWDLQNAETEHTGVYVSAFVHTASVTRGERRALRERGLHLVEQAAHVTENPDMEDTVEEVPVDELDDAAETDTELVLELEQDFVDRAV